MPARPFLWLNVDKSKDKLNLQDGLGSSQSSITHASALKVHWNFLGNVFPANFISNAPDNTHYTVLAFLCGQNQLNHGAL